MNILIDKNTGKTAYMQVYDAIRGKIATGELRPGEKLPSRRQLAEETGVSVITVQHAYELLTAEGYIQPKDRSGYYVDFGAETGSSLRKAVSMPAVPARPVQPAEEDFPFSVLAKTMRRVLTEYDKEILSKAPGSGCPELRTAIADYLKRSRGVSVQPEQIVVGSGAEYLYGLVVQLMGREREYALEAPCYEKITLVYQANGAVCAALQLGPDGILTEELQHSHAGVLHVTPYNSFPSGVTATAQKRREYAAWALRNDSYIVEDDYDAEFAAKTKRIETIFSIAPERVVYMNSFTRTMAPGMRMAYMVLPEALLARYEEKLSFYSCTVPVFDQYVLAEFIADGSLERCINRRRRKLRREEGK